MADRILDDISHRRYNPLRGSWVLVSPHRTKRPWQGQQEPASKTLLPVHDPSCFLCPNNPRANGVTMPDYKSTYIFTNDYSAVKDDQPSYTSPAEDSLLIAHSVSGKCYVITFNPAHNLTLADLAPPQIVPVIETWRTLYCSLLPPSSPEYVEAPKDSGIEVPKEQYRYLQIFENKGSAMGCSNPHPHGQAWCTSSLPEELGMEFKNLTEYKKTHPAGLLEDYLNLELQKQTRVVFANASWVLICPFWAVWPFETILIPRRRVPSIASLTASEISGLAEALAQTTKRYDNLFETQFPYSMGLHQAPLDASEEEREFAHLHLHFYPPLLRSATVRKFLVGFELLGEPQRDITPEQAADRLRALDGEKVYRELLVG